MLVGRRRERKRTCLKGKFNLDHSLDPTILSMVHVFYAKTVHIGHWFACDMHVCIRASMYHIKRDGTITINDGSHPPEELKKLKVFG